MVTKIVDGVKIEITDDEAKTQYSWSETKAQKLRKIKEKRADKLAETDWWVLRGNMSEAQSTYRQALRNIPQDFTTEEQYDLLLTRNEETGELTHSVWSKP